MASKGGDYEIGYGKPPRRSQWAKGTSGNYAGRPRNRKFPPGPSHSFNPFLESFLKEMWRLVPLREGDQSIQLPVFEALVRGMVVQALKGDHGTAKFLVQQMEAATDRREKEMAMMLSDVKDYKARWPSRVAEARRGLKPVPFPHPAHYNLSLERGVLEITGPSDHEGAVAWEQVKELLRDIEQSTKQAEARLNKDPNSDEAKAELRRCKQELRSWETCIPPGWNWREQVDLKPFLQGVDF